MQVVLFLLGLFVVLFIIVRKAIMDSDNGGGYSSSTSSSSDWFDDFMESRERREKLRETFTSDDDLFPKSDDSEMDHLRSQHYHDQDLFGSCHGTPRGTSLHD